QLALEPDRLLLVAGGRIEVAAHAGDRAEVAERDRRSHRLPLRLEMPHRFLVQRRRPLEVALDDCNRGQLGEAPPGLALVTELDVEVVRSRPAAVRPRGASLTPP